LGIMPPGHVFMGTDYPYDMAETDPVGFVKGAVQDEELRGQILGKNVASVLGL
jgi:aminocarboxymuconate-semialdehyde decarboxylase